MKKGDVCMVINSPYTFNGELVVVVGKKGTLYYRCDRGERFFYLLEPEELFFVGRL